VGQARKSGDIVDAPLSRRGASVTEAGKSSLSIQRAASKREGVAFGRMNVMRSPIAQEFSCARL
jgi:hypothetical protein